MSFMVDPYAFGAGAAPINADVQMAASSTTSVTPPTHASGDMLVAFAYRDGNNNTPAVPAGWTAFTATGLIGVNTNCCVAAYKVAASPSETCTGWTNATGLICAVVKAAGAGPLGIGVDSEQVTGNTNAPTATGLTLSNTDGHSVVLFFAGHRNTTQDSTQVPAGMSLGVGGTGNGSACTIGGAYTTTGVAAWASANAAWGGVASGWASITVEITGAA